MIPKLPQKTFKTADGSYWFGYGEGILCSPPAEFLKQHARFIVLMADGRALTYNHGDARDGTWAFPLNNHITGWVPHLENEENRDLQRFLTMNTPASGEAIELDAVQVLDKGIVKIAVRTPLSVSVFLSVSGQ